MKTQSFLIVLTLSCSTICSGKNIERIPSSVSICNFEQKPVSESDSIRSKNIELIDKLIQDIRENGALKGEPVYLINKIVYYSKDYIAKRDTMSILGEGELHTFSIISEQCSQMHRELYKIKGNSQVIEIFIKSETMSIDSIKAAQQKQCTPWTPAF